MFLGDSSRNRKSWFCLEGVAWRWWGRRRLKNTVKSILEITALKTRLNKLNSNWELFSEFLNVQWLFFFDSRYFTDCERKLLIYSNRTIRIVVVVIFLKHFWMSFPGFAKVQEASKHLIQRKCKIQNQIRSFITSANVNALFWC